MSKKYASSTVANASIRNILSEISVALFDDVTEEYLKEAASYFEYKCPYTGDDIEYEIKNNIRTNLEMDHIIPINRKHLGLNARGNTIYVRKNANSCKGEKSYEEFLIKFGIDNKIPQKVIDDRIQKIKKFQEDYNYNHNLIYSNIKNEIQEIYDQVNNNQEKYTRQLISKINKSHAKVSTNDDLMDFRYFLEKQIGYGSAYSYVTALRKLLINEGITIKELEKKKGLIDLLIDKYKNDKELKEGTTSTVYSINLPYNLDRSLKSQIELYDRDYLTNEVIKELEFRYLPKPNAGL